MAGAVGRVRAWVVDHHLQLARLAPGPRRVVVSGLAVAVTAAVAMVVATRTTSAATGRCTSTGGTAMHLVEGAVALLAVTVGLGLLASADRSAPPRLARTRLLLLMVLPAVILLSGFSFFGPVGSGWTTVFGPVRSVMLFGALALTVMVGVLGLGGRRSGWGLPVVAAVSGPVALAATLVVGAPAAGLCRTSQLLVGILAEISYFAVFAVPVLLIWLAVEGLRLSGDWTTWALGRMSENRLLAVLLGVKLVLLLIGGALIIARRAPDWLQARVPASAAGWLIGLVLVLAICALLSFETRLVNVPVDDFAVVTRGFTLLVSAGLAGIPLYGVVMLGSTVVGRPRLLLALVVCAAAAIGAGLAARRGRPVPLAVGLVGLAAGLALLLWAHQTSAPVSPAAIGLDPGRLALILGLLLLAGLALILALMLVDPVRRRLVAFLVGLTLWVGLALALPAVLGRANRPTLDQIPVAVDVLLTVAIAGLAVAARSGRQRRVSAYELILLLVTGSVIIEVPVVLGLLPGWSQQPLLLFAFLSPLLVALTLEAPLLNQGSAGRPDRLYATLGISCLGYGLLGALVLSIPDGSIPAGDGTSTLIGPLDVLQNMVGFLNGVAALPLAVLLVAVMSAQRQREQAVPG